MPAPIPTLNALWRPTGSSTRDDRDRNEREGQGESAWAQEEELSRES